jgi:hypothetical protein
LGYYVVFTNEGATVFDDRYGIVHESTRDGNGLYSVTVRSSKKKVLTLQVMDLRTTGGEYLVETFTSKKVKLRPIPWQRHRLVTEWAAVATVIVLSAIVLIVLAAIVVVILRAVIVNLAGFRAWTSQ